MATELERLVVSLEASITKYEKAMARATQVSDKRAREVERRWKKLDIGREAFTGFVRGALATLAPILSVAAAINTAKAAMQEFGQVADTALATGLDPEFLQAVTYQFSLFGVSTEQAGSALATFAKNAGLAAEGKGRMVTALKALNPELLNALRSTASQEERLRLVADALDQEADASKRAAIATAAFGEAGTKMAAALDGGSAALDRTLGKAKELGIVVDRELIARADELGDKYDTAAKILDLQFKQALIELAPFLISTVQGVTNLVVAAREFLALFDIKAGGGALPYSPSDLAAAKRLLSSYLRTPEMGAGGFDSDFFGAFQFDEDGRVRLAVREVTDLLDETGGSVRRLHNEYDAWADDGIQKMIDKHKEWAETMSGEITNAVMDIWDAFREGEDVLDVILQKALDLGNALMSSGLNSLLGGLFGGVLGGGWNIPTSFVPGGFFPAFPGMASGGHVSAGRPYIVGEKRPELFVPSSAGTILPQVPQAMGGASFVFNISGSRDDAAAIMQVIEQRIPTLIERYNRNPYRR